MNPECHTALCHNLRSDVSPPDDDAAWQSVVISLPLSTFVDRVDQSFMTGCDASTLWLLDALFDRLVHRPQSLDGPSRHTVLAGVWARASTWAKYWAHAGQSEALSRLAYHTDQMSDIARTTIWKEKSLDITLGAVQSGSSMCVSIVSANSTPHACATTLSVLLTSEAPVNLLDVRSLANHIPHLVSALCSIFFLQSQLKNFRQDAWVIAFNNTPAYPDDWIGVCRNVDCEDSQKIRWLDLLWCSLPAVDRPAVSLPAISTLFASARRRDCPLWTAEQDRGQLEASVSSEASRPPKKM